MIKILIPWILIIQAVLFGQNSICETCVEYTLEITGDKLVGSSLQFAGYDVSMNLPTEFSKDSLNIDYLFKIIGQHDIRGEFIFPDGRMTEIKYSLITFNGTVTVFMKTSNGWYPWDKIRIENRKLIFSYDYWYCPPATKADLDILELCFYYLRDSTDWHQNDNRDCVTDETDKKLSLFCAIRIASTEIMGEYNHRGKVIQTTRFVIDELYPEHGYAHTLMDFNNDSSTSFDDIIKVLTIVNNRIEKEIFTNRK